MNRCWNFARDQDTGERTLYLEGPLATESWFGDEVTPAVFRAELNSGQDDITVWVNSPGGDCVAASEIYTALMEYPGDVTVKISGLAASAASVVCMAGTKVLMSPTSIMMLHNPFVAVIGDSDEMRRAIQQLEAVKDSILNAYEIKTGLPRVKLSHMMDGVTYLQPRDAIELKFADGMLYEERKDAPINSANWSTFNQRSVTNSLLDRMRLKPHSSTKPSGIPAESLEKRLFLLQHNDSRRNTSV